MGAASGFALRNCGTNVVVHLDGCCTGVGYYDAPMVACKEDVPAGRVLPQNCWWPVPGLLHNTFPGRV
ncbi:hypothetical protein Nepgr_026624 [Nepenthes gracilis]|uniref:Uncharacterized protein n=1 Tax=Nepenthes gracilis TaxID=150966 RepID=A0AAD3Y2P3_NEPGR|nr:hypothetical protein Nepgr_026624 [Nepenthes gracilis]